MFKTFAFLSGLIFVGAAGCGVEEWADCVQVCDRYQDCFDSDYDRDSCVDECSDKAIDDEEYAADVSSCEACIDDQSCTGSFDCVDECIGIVP